MKQYKVLQQWCCFLVTHKLVSVAALILIIGSSFASNLFASRIFPVHAAGSFSAYTSAVLANQPAAYYHLDETTGTTASDVSGNNYNATYTGSFQSQTGIFGNGSDAAVQLAGDNGYISTANQSTPLAATTGNHDRTVELWFNTSQNNGNLFATGTAGHTSIFDISLVGGGGPGGCGSQASAGLYIRFWDNDLHLTGLNLADSQWHYVVVTVSNSGNTVNVFVDNKQPAGYVWNGSCYTPNAQAQPFSMPFPVNTTATPIGIGNSDWGSGFNGDMDEVAIYPTALTATQVAAHYTAAGQSTTPPPSISNAVGYVVDGKPGVSQNWSLGSFDAPHTVTFSEPISCFTEPGCALDGWSASIGWGDSTAASTATVLCLVPPLPGPAPTPPPPVTVHCTIQGSHTYSARGAYPITMTLNNSPSTITGEAEITSSPDQGAIKASVGEMVAFDSTGPGSQFIPCTATTILSANQVTVVTAAHCVGNVLDGGHVYSHLKFAPGHTGPTCAALEGCGTNPFGVFQAAASDVTIVPDVRNKQRLDWAFIRFAPLAGNNVGQVVPGLAIEFNAPPASTWEAIGYPHGKQVGPPGQYQLFSKTCSGSSTSFDGSPPPPGPLQLIMTSCGNSGLTEGSSGGPWLSSAGTVGTVNKAIGSAGLLGTYLGNEAQTAFLTVSLG